MEQIKGKIKSWSEIKSVNSNLYKLTLQIENDNRFFGLFSKSETSLKKVIDDCPLGKIIEFNNKMNGNYNNIDKDSIKVHDDTCSNSEKVKQKELETKQNWEIKEKRKFKENCLTKVTGFFNLCHEQGLIKNGEVVDEAKFNNFKLLWFKTVDKTVDFIYDTQKINGDLQD